MPSIFREELIDLSRAIDAPTCMAAEGKLAAGWCGVRLPEEIGEFQRAARSYTA